MSVYPPINKDRQPGDPVTPLMRVYEGDLVRIRIQAGGQSTEHNFTMHGMKWLQGGSGHGAARRTRAGAMRKAWASPNNSHCARR